jgi:L-ribulose-5-phosphate 3-epimerase
LRIFGHTMGTPDLTVEEALDLFARLELDGAEVVVQDGYRSGIPERDDAALEAVRLASLRSGVPIEALTPYAACINSLDDDELERDVDRLRRVISMAATLGASRIRVYSGQFSPDESAVRPAKWDRLVESLRRLGADAADRGIVLCCENHFSTMTLSAAETADLVREVDSPAVRALYDQANLTFTHQEGFEDAIRLQSGLIGHVHIKDLVFTDPERPFVAAEVATVAAEERAVRSRVVGEGILDWQEILRELSRDGYDGDASLEYEYRWHPQDLPPPAEGIRRGAAYVRRILAELDEESR